MAETWTVHGLLNVILSLVAVLALFLGAIVLLRRYGNFQQGTGGRLRILDGLALNSRDRVVLLEVENQRILLAVSPGNIQALHVVGDTGTTPASAQTTFQEQFEQRLQTTTAGSS